MSRWTIYLRPEPSDVPEEVRVRQALKLLLLRACRLRCVGIERDATPGRDREDESQGGD